MSETKFAIVTTTINVPHLLTNYARDARRFSRQVEFIVVGDHKTPVKTAEYCQELSQSEAVACHYLSVLDQQNYLRRWPSFSSFLPFNCIQRRNVGMLYAYFNNYDVVVTIDDDNLLCDADYLGRHAHLGKVSEIDAVHSESGWWNVCELLNEARNLPFYHRGHPLSERFRVDEDYRTVSKVKGRVVVNAGLWLDDPDIDALTRLYAPIRVTGRHKDWPAHIACDLGTWAPFNSQNTALLREVIPAYCLFPHCGRYDDIWASYVVRRISDQLGDVVSYGAPLVRQKRNQHNLLRDLDAERLGMEYTDCLVAALRDCSLSSSNYREAFLEISAQIEPLLAQHCKAQSLSPEPLAPLIRGFHEYSRIY
jgi:hypothetical protein